MVNSISPVTSRKWNTIALVFSGAIVVGGFIVSVVTGEWIALISASGLAILPMGVFIPRKK